MQNKQIFNSRRGAHLPSPSRQSWGWGTAGSSSYSSVWLGFGIDFHFLQPLFSRSPPVQKHRSKGEAGLGLSCQTSKVVEFSVWRVWRGNSKTKSCRVGVEPTIWPGWQTLSSQPCSPSPGECPALGISGSAAVSVATGPCIPSGLSWVWGGCDHGFTLEKTETKRLNWAGS